MPVSLAAFRKRIFRPVRARVRARQFGPIQLRLTNLGLGRAMPYFSYAISDNPMEPDLRTGIIEADDADDAVRRLRHSQANVYALPSDFDRTAFQEHQKRAQTL